MGRRNFAFVTKNNMTIDTEIVPWAEHLKPLWKKYRLVYVYVFGSYARQTQHAQSDIDLLICPPKGFSLLDLAALHLEVEQILQKKADIATEKAISPFLRPFIDSDKQLIYSTDQTVYCTSTELFT